MNSHRIVWVDWMRVAACFMVMIVHSTEPFYLGGDGSLILTQADAFWSSFFDCFARASVPLFVVASSYLQFPLHYPAGEFCRRRAVRVLVPFAIWTLIYACVWGTPADNLKSLLLNFNYSAGHLWFVYMLIGVYFLMPLLSPWAEKVGKKELQVYLAIWLFTTTIPLIRDYMSSDPLSITYGPTGIPRQALYPLWGEASWNGYGLFYYLSGFIGYLLLGLYFRRFVGKLSWKKTLAVALPCWLAGFAIAFGGFLRRVYETCGGVFPAEGLVNDAVYWETTWCNDTLGVALMTIGWILLFRKITGSGTFYEKVLLPVSKASYGVYLSHILILVPIAGAVRGWLGSGDAGVLGFWTTPVEILLSAILAFLCTSLLSVLLQRIPKIGKYIAG
ncbi:MAG: acyltransferase family protein [Bacteroidales bacterium]|nr:acyltransferase family protein [Bacteroidales bacterium]